MFVVNRGPKGLGFRHCDWCGYACPDDGKGHQRSHRNPMTGDPCRKDLLTRVDLSHEFQTDVAILRILASITLPEIDPESPEQRMNAFRATLGEAIRLATTKLMNILPGEIRVTTMRRGHGLDVVLYDSVAGGAGYCLRLGKDISIRSVLELALEQLECPANCSTSCSACLNDYSNQRYWDVFDRKLTSSWLSGLVGDSLEDTYVESGLSPWSASNLISLKDDIVSAGSISIFTKTFFGAGEWLEEPRRWLLEVLAKSVSISIYVPNREQVLNGTGSKEIRSWVRTFEHYMESGQLKLFECVRIFADQAMVPRFANLEGNLGWYTGMDQTPFMAEVLPKPVYRGYLFPELKTVLGEAHADISREIVAAFQPVSVIDLPMGKVADLGEIFSPLKNAYIEKLTIEDPYCVSDERTIASLIKFLKQLRDLAAQTQETLVIGKELNRRDPRYVPVRELESGLRQILTASGVKASVRIKPYKNAQAFHDRCVEAVIISEDGSEVVWRFDLSGGVDKLLDVRSDTKVYRYMQ